MFDDNFVLQKLYSGMRGLSYRRQLQARFRCCLRLLDSEDECEEWATALPLLQKLVKSGLFATARNSSFRRFESKSHGN